MSTRPTVSELTCGAQFDGTIDDSVVLNENQRHRRRVVMKTLLGTEFLLDLPEAQLLLHGDILKLSNGIVVEVRAMPEDLLKVSATSTKHLLSLAWQIGNRHLAAQIFEDHILIRRDQVITKMLIGLGADVEEVEAPFNPEGGAYKHHDHSHD